MTNTMTCAIKREAWTWYIPNWNHSVLAKRDNMYVRPLYFLACVRSHGVLSPINIYVPPQSCSPLYILCSIMEYFHLGFLIDRWYSRETIIKIDALIAQSGINFHYREGCVCIYTGVLNITKMKRFLADDFSIKSFLSIPICLIIWREER